VDDVLSYSTVISPAVPIRSDEIVPDGTPRQWSPITSTVIWGDRDAVLVDPPLTVPQAVAVTDWIVASGKRLTAIFSTHGHGDHWFGTSTVRERFPEAVHYAQPAAIETMRSLAAPEQRRDRWDVQFPGLIGDTTVHAVAPPGGSIELEGHDLVPVDTGHTDTDGTSVLHVPSIGLVVAGDVVYANVHQSLREGSADGFLQWIAALDAVAALSPSHVVCGHKDPSRDDDPRHIDETRGYLLDVLALLDGPMTARDFFDAMRRRHPHRLNTGALWSGAQALFPTRPNTRGGTQ
jgi:glyoxylase-like metal-dependent hydrolase (beta-lactamase superfamily II)